MNKKDLERLIDIEKRIKEIAIESGLLTTDIIFEIVPAQRVLEGMAYMFPTNFSHWSFGRDYEKYRTIYEHTGQGIPYEQVWNFDVPKALLVETNPLALNILVIAHVYGHVDYFLGNRYLQHGRSFSNISEEARNASIRFAEYEAKYGIEYEKIIDAGMSIMWHQNPDPFFEELDEDIIRERLIELERAKLEKPINSLHQNHKLNTREEIQAIEKKLENLQYKTPPEPTHDLLKYIIKKSPRPLKPWMIDVFTVIRNQARCLTPNGRTKMLDEGWATYWHVKIMRQLFKEGLLTSEEHGVFDEFHSKVTKESKKSFNWYGVGLALFEYIKERWDKGQFGREYEDSTDIFKRSNWDTKANKGTDQIFNVRSFYTDRMAVEDFFTDEFIRARKLYLYEPIDEDGNIFDVIVEDDPNIIRQLLKTLMSSRGPQIVVEDGNYQKRGCLYLRHIFTGYELDPKYRDATLSNINYLWGNEVILNCMEEGKAKNFSFNKNNRRKKKKK